MENQSKLQIKRLRSELWRRIRVKGLWFHAPEDRNQTWAVVCSYSAGVSERKNRHLVESCRAGRCYRPREFRRFLGANALAFLHKKTPSSAISNKTLYDMLHKKVPDVGHSLASIWLCLLCSPAWTVQREVGQEGGQMRVRWIFHWEERVEVYGAFDKKGVRVPWRRLRRET